MKIFKDLGLHITFIGANFFKHEPYTSILQQMGINVLYGWWDHQNWEKWLKENLKFFDFILLSRPHISIKYLEVIKETNFKGRLLYYAHDLHFLRLMREYEFLKKRKIIEECEKVKNQEYKIFNEVDIVLLASSKEKKLLLKDFPEEKIYIAPPFLYEGDFPLSKNEIYEKRKDILFVGGFQHIPNYYGIKWFIEKIWHKVKLNFSELKLNIVGSKVPKDIKRLEKIDKRIKVLGYVSEEKLKKLYDEVKIVISPLTYGAGIKGKIIEAIAYGVPVVTTPIGAEGIKNASEIMLIAKNENEFVKHIYDLMVNRELWYLLRSREVNFSKENLSYGKNKEIFAEILGL